MPRPSTTIDVAASSAITNTITETAFTKKVALPAGALQAGDVVRIRGQGIATATNSTDTLGIKVYIGATEVLAIAAVDVADNDIFVFDEVVQIRTAGASGTCVAAGVGGTGAAGTITMKGLFKASQAIDTTAQNDVQVKATWSVASASNSCRLDVLDVEVDRTPV